MDVRGFGHRALAIAVLWAGISARSIVVEVAFQKKSLHDGH